MIMNLYKRYNVVTKLFNKGTIEKSEFVTELNEIMEGFTKKFEELDVHCKSLLIATDFINRNAQSVEFRKFADAWEFDPNKDDGISNEMVTFKEAVEEQMVDVYDDDCLKYMNKAKSGLITDIEIEDALGPIVSQYLVTLYLKDRNKFADVVGVIHEQYLIDKRNDDEHHRVEAIRDRFRLV